MKKNNLLKSGMCVLLSFVFIATSSTAEAAITGTLTVGSKGQQVKELQQALTSLGFYYGPVNGNFGPLTRAAVIKFQKAYTISPHAGYVGNLTRKKLNEAMSTSATRSSSGTSINPTSLQPITLNPTLTPTQMPAPTPTPTPTPPSLSPVLPPTPTPAAVVGPVSVELKIDGVKGPISAAWNTSHTLSWTVTGNPISCVAVGNWSGSKNQSGGSETVVIPTNVYGGVGYALNCSGVFSGFATVNIIVPKGAAFMQSTRPAPVAAVSNEISSNTITSCGVIKRAGNYLLGNDISSKGMTCLSVLDVSQVTIDCNNHTIAMDVGGKGVNDPAMYMKNVSNFSLKSCTTNITNNTINWPTSALFISRGANGIISNNNFASGDVGGEDSTNIQVMKNTFTNSVYTQLRGHNIVTEDNIFDPPQKKNAGSSPVGFLFGSNNRISRNTIDGKSNGIFQDQLGYDDGIVLQDEDGDTIDGNTLKNFWDCGIETTGYVRNTQMTSNKISNSPVCGIGGWYWNSWRSNTVAQNTVDTSGTLFMFSRNYGLRPSDNYISDSPIYFKDNVFRDNIFTNPITTQSHVSSLFNMYQQFGPVSSVGSQDGSERQAISSDFITGNNQFINNDFGKTQGAPTLNPTGMVIDGGGNKCGQTPSSDYPLKCN